MKKPWVGLMFSKCLEQIKQSHGNNRADALANAGRESNALIETDEEDWPDKRPALHGQARLQALDAKHMYNILLRRNTKDVPPMLHQEKLDDAKNRVQQTTRLRPGPTAMKNF